jgi:N-hydroxyarylamine O-acetyltransferase
MSDEIFNLDAYLARINFSGNDTVSEETLRDLHIAHTLHVPFENLDVFYKRPIRLDEASLYRKIVEKRRGGYCFEMNGIFSAALKKLGFKATNLLARVAIDDGCYTPKTHQVILVETENKKWLADVGFGNDGMIAPLLMEENIDQKQFAHIYRIINDPTFGYVLQKKEKEIYRSLYAFTIDKCYPEDFVMSSHYTATFPESFFIKMRFCTRPTKEGRITLVDNQMKISKNGFSEEKPVKNDEDFNRYLDKYFGLNPEESI